MRIIVINPDLSVEEIDRDEEAWLPDDEEWDAVSIADGTHDAYVDDNGLFKPGTVTANLDGNVIPLPAYIVGVDGEDVVDASLGLDDVRSMIS